MILPPPWHATHLPFSALHNASRPAEEEAEMSHADVHDNSPEVENAKRWSDAELLKLGDMLERVACSPSRSRRYSSMRARMVAKSSAARGQLTSSPPIPVVKIWSRL